MAEALRAKQVVPEAAAAVEAKGPALEDSWAAGPAGVEVADAGGALDVTATVDAAAPQTPATVTVARDGRTVVTVSLSEVQPGYWALDQLWACAEEIAVTEVRDERDHPPPGRRRRLRSGWRSSAAAAP